MTAEDGAPGTRIRLEECDPPRRLVVQFLDEMAWRLEVDLAEDGGTTTLTFTQVFPAGTDVAEFATGWHWYLDRLDAALTGAAVPADWDTFLTDVGPVYTAAAD